MDAIIKNIERRENLQDLHLTWFGGEPLMAIDKMQEFYRKFRPVFKGKFSSNIITTAHHIDERVIDILKEIEISSIQITLDGMEQTHNSVKFTEGCSNAFRRVLSNIDLLVEKYPELGIVVRVNTTKSNSAEYIELHNLIGKRYKGKVSMSPGLVMNRTNDPSVTNLFDREDFSKFSLDLWQKHRIVSSWLMYQNSPHSECAIRNRNALSVDPEGNVYQCWENIGNKKRTIGRLDSEGNLTNINQTELNRNLHGADPIATPKCIKCSYLPLCGGGCPIQRIQNEFEGTKNDICSSYKNHIKDWLLTYLELKKLGIMREKK
jgi:arylsulfatase regulator